MPLADIFDLTGIRFLVTGGAGFIGSNLCRKILESGGFVRCFDNLSTGNRSLIKPLSRFENFEFAEGDIRNQQQCFQACEGIDFVLHQAAWGSVPRSLTMPSEYVENNVVGTQHIFDAAIKQNVQRVVYASSSSVYGDCDQLPQREDRVGHVLSPYALTKKMNEETAHLYARCFGLKAIGLRYFNVFGPHQNPEGPYAAVIPKFICTMLQGKSPIVFGDGLQRRDFTYVDQVVSANLKACFCSEGIGEVFNISGGRPMNLLEIVSAVNLELGTSLQAEFAPPRQGDIRHSFADISKAERILGYRRFVDFETGLRRTIDYFQARTID